MRSRILIALLVATALLWGTAAEAGIFRSSCSVDSTTDVSVGRCTLPDTVPAGKRLFIETVTGTYWGDAYVLGAAYLTIAGHRYGFPWVQSGALTSDIDDRRFYGFNHAVKLYVDGPASVRFDAYGGASQGGGSYSATYAVSGRLKPLPPE